MLTKRSILLIHGYMVIRDSPLGVGEVVIEWVLISGGTQMTKLEWTHRQPSESHTHRLPVPDKGALASSKPSEGCHNLPTGARRDMTQQKLKVKTLEATKKSKMLSTKIILKLKKLGAKFCKLESQIFWLDSCRFESSQLKSTHSSQFYKQLFLYEIVYLIHICYCLNFILFSIVSD